MIKGESMDKIYVYANDVKFGELSFEDGFYTFTPYEFLKDDKATFGFASLTKLDLTKPTKSDTLFAFFVPYLVDRDDEEEMLSFGISEYDNDFEVLLKVADYTRDSDMCYIRTN